MDLGVPFGFPAKKTFFTDKTKPQELMGVLLMTNGSKNLLLSRVETNLTQAFML